MATNFTKQAATTLKPVFTQQIAALKSQLPAIDQLYEALGQGLQGQKQAETQGIFESASGRGLLRSTIPVDQQTGLEQSYLQKGTQLASDRMQKVAGVNKDITGVNVNMAQAIAQLAQALRSQDLAERQFGFTKSQANRQLKLQSQLANRDFSLQKKLANKEYEMQKELIAMGIF